MLAVLFPGQGSQFVGMGLDFYERFETVKKNFETVDKVLGFSLSNLILKGPEEKLRFTQNTQPAIMTIGVSIFEVLNQKFKLDLNNAKFFAGHSLGEYTALVCAGSLSIDKAAYLLHERGKSMQEAVPNDQGAMIAILGMTIEDAVESPRFHHQWLPDVIQIEKDSFSLETLKKLQQLKHNIKARSEIGESNCIMKLDNGQIHASSDSRRGASAIAY